MKTTIKDIAEAAGVSPITVSRVIAGGGNVKEDTRKKVLQTMQSMDYHFKVKAKKESSLLNKNIAILAEDISDFSKLEITNRLCEYILSSGYLPIICLSPAGNWLRYINSMRRNLAGIIAISMLGDQVGVLEEAANMNIPLVAIHRCVIWAAANSVVTDDYKSAEIAMDYLYGLGHRNIVLVNMEDGLAGAYEAISGYKKGLQNHGLPFHEKYVYGSPFDRESGRKIAEKIQAETPEITAVISASESVAWGIVDSYYGNHGRSVPDYVSVMTFDISDSNHPGRKMTAVGSHLSEIAKISSQTIIDYIEKAELSHSSEVFRQQKVILRPELFEGATAGPVRKEV